MRKLALALTTALALAGGAVAVVESNSSPAPQSAMGSVAPAGWGQTPPGFTAGPRALTAVPTATMYDAVTIGNIPHGPFAVAGYTAGLFPTWNSLLRDFPGAHHVSIAISTIYHAACLDVEPGDAVPAQAGGWVIADIRAGFPRPCVYSDLSEMPAVQASLRAALGSSWHSRVLLWLAWYRGFPGLVSGYDAVQYTQTCLGRNLDCSTVSLAFLTIADPPYVPPKPTPLLPLCFSHRESRAQCAAVKAKVASDIRAAQSSARAFNDRDDFACVALERRAAWFSTRLRTQPRTKVAYRRGALAATTRAYNRIGCGVLAQRYDFFSAAAKKLKAAN